MAQSAADSNRRGRWAIAITTLACCWTLGCAHTVTVQTQPPGATVEVNGKEIGVSPVEFEEESDPNVHVHEVVVRLNGHETRQVRLTRSEPNLLALLAIMPACGGLGWIGGAVLLVSGVALSLPTLGCALLPGTAGALVLALAGCGWSVVTSPSLLLLTRVQQLPDEIYIELEPSGFFSQQETTSSDEPVLLWNPEQDGYWQNPQPDVEEPRLPPPTSDEDAGAATSTPTSRPAY